MFEFFDSSQFMSHGMCLLWRMDLLALHVVSDALIALAYFSIPIAVLLYVRRRPDFQFGKVAVMFAAFILLCGLTHIVSIWTFWNPDYALQGLIKGATALVSVATAVVLFPLLPKLLAMPTLDELNATNAKLAQEIRGHADSERRYRDLADTLEQQVRERTQGLQETLQRHLESEYRFRGAFDNARSGKAIGDVDGKWVRVNQSLCRMLGYEQEELLALGWLAVTHPDDRVESNLRANSLLNDDSNSYTQSKRYVTKDGRTLHALVDISLVKDDTDGTPLFYISEVQDLTEMVGLEAAVQHSEARAQALIDTARDAIFELDSNGVIRACNPAANAMTTLTVTELIGHPIEALFGDETGAAIDWQRLLVLGGSDEASQPEGHLYVRRAEAGRIPVEMQLWRSELGHDTIHHAIVRDVSERIAAERALRRAHEELRFQMANSPLAVIQWGDNFTIDYWSPAAERVFGWSSEEAVVSAANGWNFVYEEDHEKVVALYEDLTSGKIARARAINRNYRRDGTVIHCEWHNSVRVDEDGNITSVLSFVEDITDRVEAHGALLRSEAHQKAILENAVDSIMSLDPGGLILSCNPATEEIFGYTADELLGRDARMLVPMRYRIGPGEYLEQLQRSKSPAKNAHELAGLRKSGEEFAMEISIREIVSEGQRTYTSFVRDISDRKKFEKEILEGNELLQRQDWLQSGLTALSRTLQGDPSVANVGEFSLDFLCEYLSAEMGALYIPAGTGPLVAVARFGAVDANLERLPPSDIAARAAKQREPVFIEVAGENASMKVHAAFGEIPLRYCCAFPVVREDRLAAVVELGTISGLHPNHVRFLEFIEDTLAVALSSASDRERLKELLRESREQALELKRRTQELNTVNQNLVDRGTALEEKNLELEAAKHEIEQKARAVEQANHYKSEFLANMSHELRTPLNSMLVLSQSLAENSSQSLTDDDVECARVINRSSENLLALINDILDLSKVEAGMLSLHLAPTSVGGVISALRDQFAPIARAKGLGFEIVCKQTDEHVSVTTDSMRLQQILRNLLSNAFKFTETGQVVLEAGSHDDELFRFRISDTGIGIPEHAQEQIFTAFQQIDGTIQRRYSGTGLGLSISRELGRLLEARFELESAPGKGSTFSVLIPRVHSRFVDGEDETFDSEWLAPGSQLSAPADDESARVLAEFRILIVTRDYRESFTLSRNLSDRGAGVEISDRIPKAAATLERENFDIALLDVCDPACGEIEEFLRVAHARSVRVIAFHTRELPDGELPDGIKRALGQPLDAEALLDTLVASPIAAA